MRTASSTVRCTTSSSDSWDIFLDAQNILQAETVLKQQVTNDGMLLPRSWFINDRRLSLGVRYRIQ